MLTRLPAGLLGLVLASLIAAFMSTISTHLNWGSSYIALDFYQRFVKPEASEKELVTVGRLSTVLLMIFSACVALYLTDALGTFQILLQIGAGTGLIFILRWFWWRVNAYSEISGMIVSFLIALYFEFGHYQLVIGVVLTTLTWIVVTLLTRPTDMDKLVSFYNAITPYGSGWNGLRRRAKEESLQLNESRDNFTADLGSMLLGILLVYTALFGFGYALYGNALGALVLLSITAISGYGIYRLWRNKKGATNSSAS